MELEIALGVIGMAGWVTAGFFALQWRGHETRLKEMTTISDTQQVEITRLLREKEGMRAALAVVSSPTLADEVKALPINGRQLLRERLAKHMDARRIAGEPYGT